MRKLDLTNDYQAQGYQQLVDMAAKMRARRIDQKLTQKQLSAITGISVSFISNFERHIFPTRLIWLAAGIAAAGGKLTIIWKEEKKNVRTY